jgi:hypothetical protein
VEYYGVHANANRQFLDFICEVFRKRATPFPSADDTLQLFHDAGFVDIEVYEKLIDFGDWREGFIPFS